MFTAISCANLITFGQKVFGVYIQQQQLTARWQELNFPEGAHCLYVRVETRVGKYKRS